MNLKDSKALTLSKGTLWAPVQVWYSDEANRTPDCVVMQPAARPVMSHPISQLYSVKLPIKNLRDS